MEKGKALALGSYNYPYFIVTNITLASFFE